MDEWDRFDEMVCIYYKNGFSLAILVSVMKSKQKFL